MSLDKVRATPGVVAIFTADDIPGVNDVGPIIHGDDPILADGRAIRRPADLYRSRDIA
jgi:Xanthine dehydrogenase, molybdopterin-binding subunit B